MTGEAGGAGATFPAPVDMRQPVELPLRRGSPIMLPMITAPPISMHASRLDLIAERLEADVAASRIPGATVVIGTRDRILFEHFVGFRNVVTRDALQPDAIWRIYSMTKPLVTVAAMTLVEQGRLRLDQPVADFIAAFGRLRVSDGAGATVPAINPPTIQDLMRHTAGLAYGYRGDSPAQRAYVADGFLQADLSNADFVERLAALPLEYQPSTVWHYSHATDVLARVLEIVCGTDLQQALEQTLLAPLDMSETVFQVDPANRSRVAEPLPAARDLPPRFSDPTRPIRAQRGGGGLTSTARDYARFLRMLLGNGTLDGCRLLSPAAVDFMTADHLGAAIGRDAYYPPGPGYGFGLGFAVRLARGEAPFPGSCGDYFWSGVGGTYFWVDPVRGFFALLLLQSPWPEQRRHYRTMLRSLVYAALD